MMAEIRVSEATIRAATVKFIEEKYGIKIKNSSLHLKKDYSGWEIHMTMRYNLEEKKNDSNKV